MDSSTTKSNKIREIVRLQQILRKWKKIAVNAPKENTTTTTTTGTNNNCSKTTTTSMGGGDGSKSNISKVVPKGFLAVCVGRELKRFIIPTEYLGHQAFHILLREAEEEFGFQNYGVLKIPCDVTVFQNILNSMTTTTTVPHHHQHHHHNKMMMEEDDLAHHHHHHFGSSGGLNVISRGGGGIPREPKKDEDIIISSPDCDHLTQHYSHHPQLCR